MWEDHCILSVVNWHSLIGYLRFDLSASHALVDIVAFLPSDFGDFMGDQVFWVLNRIEKLRELPASCCMRDGRKWNKIPCVLLNEDRYVYAMDLLLGAGVPRVQYASHHNYFIFEMITLRELRRAVENYQKQVLASYHTVGILVDEERGRLRVKWALQKRDLWAENEYYYAQGDRRRLSDYVTVHRDVLGIAHDAQLFEELLNDPKTRERHLQRFFEQNPAFLMDAMRGVPISHRPRFVQPKDWTPDFVLPPTVATPDGDRLVHLTELKGVHVPLLSETLHRGFSHNVMSAINQVRDYDRILRERKPANLRPIIDTFGYEPEATRKAVVIGRTPQTRADQEVLTQRMAEQPDVRIVSYDEILQAQHSQIRRGPWMNYV
jgi:hypothetical protein